MTEPPAVLSTTPVPVTTLAGAKSWLEERLFPTGTSCPCCGQHAQLYRRRLNGGMALALLEMYRADPNGWMHKPTVLRGLGASARDESLLRYWGLLEEERQVREDGGRAGWWRLTHRGRMFVRGRLTVHSHIWIYNNRMLGFDGEQVTIRACMSSPFRYDALMSGL